jgi:hypothetical protein
MESHKTVPELAGVKIITVSLRYVMLSMAIDHSFYIISLLVRGTGEVSAVISK